MRKSTLGIIIFALIQLFAFIQASTSSAQTSTPTSGLIYKPATNGGNKILDPNGDGYVSRDKYGFPGVNMDEGVTYSEINYKPFPVFMDEPLRDLSTGAKEGHTDFAPKGTGSSPLAVHFDGTNFMFRVRLGGQSTASKGYSILIDANNLLNSTGKNPGFEYEIVLCTNFDVRVYYHGNNTNSTPAIDAPGNIIFNGSVDQYSQKAIASSFGGGDADYFYDFYVPISVFNQTIAILANTQLRMTGVTVTSAKSGLFGVASDIGGVDDTKYKGNLVAALRDIITNTPSTTPTGIQTGTALGVTAKAPIVSGPIYVSHTTITGYSVEAPGSIITVLQNGVGIGNTVVGSNGNWTFTLNGITLAVNNIITATLSTTGKTNSPASLPLAVQNTPVNPCRITTQPPLITSVPDKGNGLNITTSTAGIIKIYQLNSDGTIQNSWTTFPSTSAGTATYELASSAGSMRSGLYFATHTPTGSSCESIRSNEICISEEKGSVKATGLTVNRPVINTTNLTFSSTVVTGTSTAGSTITIFKNSVEVARITTSSSGNWTYNIPSGTLIAGDVFWARATLTLSEANCNSITSDKSVSATVSSATIPTTKPVITGTYCGSLISTINGISNEAPGTGIEVFYGSTSLGTTKVNAFGAWSLTGLGLSLTTPFSQLTARATAVNKTVSSSSDAVSIETIYSASTLSITTNTPIIEGNTSISGKAPNNSFVTLYINGEAYLDRNGNVVVVQASSNGDWTISNISPFDFYPGAKLTVTAKASTTSTCESVHSTADVTVLCKPASTGMTASFSKTAAENTITICPGTRASVYLSSSEIGAIYNVFRKNTGGTYEVFGPSVLGTGKPLTLESDLVTTSGTILQVKTMRVGANCIFDVGVELTVNLYPPVPKNYAVTFSPAGPVCPNSQVTITVRSAEKDYSYQLIKIVGTIKQNIGSPLLPIADDDISFPATTVAENTKFGVVVKSTITNCMDENVILIDVAVISNGPIVNQAVTSSTTAVCVGGSATFTFTGETGATYSLTDVNSNTIAGSAVTVNGAQVTISTGTTITATEGIKNFRIRVVSGSCNTFLTAEPSLVVSNGPAVPVSAGNVRKICERTFQLEGSAPAPGTGEWSVIGPDGILSSQIIFTNRTSNNTTVTVPTSGVYFFTWTVTSACTNAKSSSTVAITINCDATFSTGSTKFFDEYLINENLVTITDIDGGISDYKILSGIRPPGSNFKIENSILYLKATDALLPGGYTFTIQTKDAQGFTTDLAMFIRIYNRDQIPGGITPLPVELMYLKAAVQARQVVLNWQTASEKDNDRFEIQRSTDGKSFTTIATEKGNGTTSKSIKYSFTDTNSLTGVSYYRLKQIDYDGKSAYSPTVSANISALEKGAALQTVNASPNPFTSELNVSVHAAKEGVATLMLYNLQGRCILKQTIQMAYGTNNYQITSIPGETGMYILKVVGNEINSNIKLIKAD